MSTLEKTIDLLETMPDDKIETVYAFVRFIDSDTYESSSEHAVTKRETIQSMLGIAHEYANPTLTEQEEGAFERAISEKTKSNLSSMGCPILSELKMPTVSSMR